MFAAHHCVFSAVLDPLIGGEVRVVTNLREIDEGVLAALERHFSDEHRLADRGAPFRATGVAVAGDPPSRRLVLAATSGNTWFIHYQHGGIALHSHLVALTYSGSFWRVVYAAAALYPYDTLPKLQQAIRKQQFQIKAYEL